VLVANAVPGIDRNLAIHTQAVHPIERLNRKIGVANSIIGQASYRIQAEIGSCNPRCFCARNCFD